MKSYLLKIRGGVERDSMGKKAGKGALIQEEVSATLGVSQDQTLFQPIGAYVTFEPGIAQREGGHIYEDVCGTLRAKAGDNQMAIAFARRTSEVRIQDKGVSPTLESAMGEGGNNTPMVAYGIENHPNDSRVGIDESGKVQTLTSRCGTGGGQCTSRHVQQG